VTSDPDIARLRKASEFQGLMKGVKSRADAIQRLASILDNRALDRRRREAAAVEITGLDSRAAFEPLVTLYRAAEPGLTELAASLLHSIVKEHHTVLSDDDLLSVTGGGRPDYASFSHRSLGGGYNVPMDDRYETPTYRLLKLVDQEGTRRGLWEKGHYQVVLAEVGPRKIQVLKEVRDLAGLGLEEAKALVDRVPSHVLVDVQEQRAAEARERLEQAGAIVELVSGVE
jgi:hypothetical protein